MRPGQNYQRTHSSRCPETGLGCVKKTRNRHAVREMEVDPPEPPCRRRLQTAISCCGPMTMVVNVMVKRRDRLITSKFLRRFLLHLLPKGFVRIRPFGFLANRRRATLLPLCRQALAAVQPQTQPPASTAQETRPLWLCPHCGGPMVVIERLTAAQIQLRSPPFLSGTAA